MSDPTDIDAVVDVADTIEHRLDPATRARLAELMRSRVDNGNA